MLCSVVLVSAIQQCESAVSIFSASWDQFRFTENLILTIFFKGIFFFVVLYFGNALPLKRQFFLKSSIVCNLQFFFCNLQLTASSPLSSQSPVPSHCFWHPSNLFYLVSLFSNRWCLYPFFAALDNCQEKRYQ